MTARSMPILPKVSSDQAAQEKEKYAFTQSEMKEYIRFCWNKCWNGLKTPFSDLVNVMLGIAQNSPTIDGNLCRAAILCEFTNTKEEM